MDNLRVIWDYDIQRGQYVRWLAFLGEKKAFSYEEMVKEFSKKYGYYPASVTYINNVCWRAGPIMKEK